MKTFSVLVGAVLVTLIYSHLIAQEQTAPLTEADRLQIAVQQICPVSGAELGSMGEPIKVQIGDQIAFLCCKGCQDKDVNAEHWQTIQANIAAAREAKSDQLHIRAQGICPVSGQKLGLMGKPIKIEVGEAQHAFLCCKGCLAKQIDAEHWQTIQANLASAQAICLVMNQPVDANSKSTIINGRKIFVCCPPCIDNINADPAAFVEKLNSQIDENLKQAVEN